MQEQTVKGALKDLRGQILNTWETLADQELEKAKHNVAELSELLQKKVGATKEKVSEKFSFILSRFNAGFEESSSSDPATDSSSDSEVITPVLTKKRASKIVDSTKTKH